MQENKFFVVFKKSMRKHIFETSNVFFVYIYKKKHSKHVRVLAVCNTQENIFCFSDIYIYLQHFMEKPGILILDLYFHNIKKITKP